MTNEALEAALNIQSLLDTGNKREEFDMAKDDSNFWRDVRLVVDAVLEGASWPPNPMIGVHNG